MTSTALPAAWPVLSPSAAAQQATAQAVAAATAAATASGVRLQPLDTLTGVQEAAALFARVWRTDRATPPLSAEVMRAVEHAGGYVVGAYAGNELVGASAGFLGLDGSTPVLHSHISGVTRPGGGIGLALKLHQRAWALQRGVETITWTFDPLVRRNAWFNLAKLGAVGVEYLVDFYGPMSDGVNGGDSTDRLFTRWHLTARPRPLPAVDRGHVLLEDRDGVPFAGSAALSADPLLVALPPDVEQLRLRDPEAARSWRLAVREALVPAFAEGCTTRGITRDGFLVLGR